MGIQYIGENLWPRYIGHAGIVLGFVSALVAALAYFISTRKQVAAVDTEGVVSWQRLGRWSFGVHGLSMVSVIGLIFYVMIAKRFEYFYAHAHVDTDLPFQYVFAAFWEGQEGSFLLWMFWHIILGLFLITRKKGENIWENPVLTLLMAVQVFLSSMILGLHFGWGEHVIKWGSNPILLFREMNPGLPLLQNPDYLVKLAPTAKGLNPLLQNYWMTIHPPTLFLGFASTVVPFCFAVAGLWLKKYTEWLQPALPWALFSGAILGTGILMGGAWAYEALSFNGYWAWDPVENMSLVPWLVLVAGIHTHLVSRATGHSIRATALFYILTFLFVLYSTFLTRSGILGDSSVHAFTELGLEWQLVLFQGFFLVVGLYLFFKNYKHIPQPEKEEALSSREFWMFIGSLVLILSVALISFTTSIPVYNKVGGFFADLMGFKKPSWTAPVDPVAHYNKSQLWIGVFMGLLSGAAQFLRFREFNFNKHLEFLGKHLAITAGFTVGLTLLGTGWIAVGNWQNVVLLFSGIFTLVSNLDYLFIHRKHSLPVWGSVLSHVGFGLLIVGILASGMNKAWISKNPFVMRDIIKFQDEAQYDKNILLLKNSPMRMSAGYEVTYESDTTVGLTRTYSLLFKRKNKDFTQTIDSFRTHPYILYDKQTLKIASTNPDTKHYWNFDVFSHIASLPPAEQDPEIAHQEEDSLQYRTFAVPMGAQGVVIEPENRPLPSGRVIKNPPYTARIVGVNRQPSHPKYIKEANDIALGVKVEVVSGTDIYYAEPLILIREDNLYQLPVTINPLNMRVKVEEQAFEQVFGGKDLDFKEYVFQQGQTRDIGGKKVTFKGVNADPQIDGFKKEAGDIAFSAQISVDTEGGAFEAAPVYIIRGSTPIPLKDEIAELGMHFAISRVNPETREVFVKIATQNQSASVFPISFAEGADRDDYIVLEATVNPGINYVWLGSILMMIGLSFAMYFRLKQRKMAAIS